MNGSDSLRGYLVQTMVLLLQALSEEGWEAVVLEPKHESEKVDIKWHYSDDTKAVQQVKSSKNSFKPGEVKAWCRDLKNSTEADEYELVLIGPSASPSVLALGGEFEGVRIPEPKPLDLTGMIKQMAHDLNLHCEQRTIPLIGPSAGEMLAVALVTMLQIGSIGGKYLTRNQLDELLKKWIFLLLPKVVDAASKHSFDAVKIASSIRSPQLAPWIQPVRLRELDDRSSQPKNYELQDLLREDDSIILVVGKSGSGKTCALQMASHILNQDTENICFWIPLRSYSRSLPSTLKSILGWYDITDDEVILTLQKHRIMLLLDGLDEVAEGQRENCNAEIQQLMQSYRGRLCISYPTTDHTYFGLDCPAYEILPLTEEQIVQIIEKFFSHAGNDADKARWFLRTIRGWSVEQKEDFDSLAQTPLNLQLLLELMKNDDFKYSSLRDLHGQVIQKRLERTGKREKSGQIPAETKIDCLMHLAFRSIVEDRPLQLLKTWVKDTFSVYLNPIERAIALKEVVRNDLLVEIDDLYIEWSHSSFRDYLAGRRLFELAEMGESFDEFPLGKLQGIAAVAHAVRFSTTQPSVLTKRSKIFLSMLQNKPIFEVVYAAAIEYHTPLEYFISTKKNVECDEAEYKRLQWGERFVEAHRLIADMARRERFSDVSKIPQPQGLLVFFDAAADFCLMIFLDTTGIHFGRIESFEASVIQMRNQGVLCAGFCLYAPFLQLLDPEIMAYLQVGVWLRLATSTKDDQRLSKWHDGLSSYLTTLNEWIAWGNLGGLPAPEFRLRAEPSEAMDFLTRSFSQADIRALLSGADLLVHSEQVLLSWQEIYNPITFRIDPIEIQTPPKFASNMLSQIMVLTPPPHHISLALLMPWSRKVGSGVHIFVPFPVQILQRYYFLYSSSSNKPFDNGVAFVHLRG